MKALVSAIDAVNGAIARAVRWLALAMVMATLAVVVLRYGFAVGAIPLQEAVMYMHGSLFLAGIAYGVQQNTHVRVDLVYSRLSPSRQRLVNKLGHGLFLLPVAAFIVYTSVPYAAASWRVLEGSSEVGGIPAVFLLKSLIPLMGVLLFLQGGAELCRAPGDAD